MVTDWPFKSGAMTAAYVFNDFQREIMKRNFQKGKNVVHYKA